MSYFEDQMDAWFDANCQGSPEDYTPFMLNGKPKPKQPLTVKPKPAKAKGQVKG